MNFAANQSNVSANQDRLLTKREIAARLSRSTRTVDAWVKRGFLPHFKIGRSIMFRWNSVLAHLEREFGVPPK